MSRQVSCQECNKSFPSKQRLTQHRRCHKKSHACQEPVCQRKDPPVCFGTKRDLLRHQQMHTRSMGKQQCPYCQAELAWRPDNFKRHVDSNHDGGITGAASRGDEETVREYLSNYPDAVDAKEGGDKTPLSLAVAAGHLNVARLLLNNKADIESTTGTGLTPLWAAITNQQTAMVDILLDWGADIEPGSPSNWIWVIKHRFHVEPLVKALVERSTDIHATVLRACGLAMKAGPKVGRDYVEMLFRMPAVTGEVASRVSTRLLADFCQDYRPFSSIWAGILVRHGADVNHQTDGKTNMMLAAELGRLEVVRSLMYHGADVNAKGKHGWTALHAAAYCSYLWHDPLPLVKRLVRQGADCRAVTDTGETPIDIALGVIEKNRTDRGFKHYAFNEIVRYMKAVAGSNPS
ncbi:ankyrin repeat-containing domain protein [Podospora aff. communis PSN243]|uniref:Ankyrin repeat-containing domain protein n=1 Tax=Podospora aff. communis PSN243 TaxID=3040156 RepID=A0AAV9G9D3_9PEZI|nr:ankyrin repeat-containing domain protein [Podospora aff. communis PSN243]